MREHRLQLSEQPFTYHLHQWLPLNQENYRRYMEHLGLTARLQLLERILTGNLLSMATGLGWHVEGPLKVELLDLQPPRPLHVYGHGTLAFDATFRANVLLPDSLGLGKHASLGHGRIEQTSQTPYGPPGSSYGPRDCYARPRGLFSTLLVPTLMAAAPVGAIGGLLRLRPFTRSAGGLGPPCTSGQWAASAPHWPCCRVPPLWPRECPRANPGASPGRRCSCPWAWPVPARPWAGAPSEPSFFCKVGLFKLLPEKGTRKRAIG
jgi:hypothetical protein